MSADQIIAEFKALPLAERRQVVQAILSEETLPETLATGEEASFSERWQGKFSLPERDPNDARLTFLLDRFSA